MLSRIRASNAYQFWLRYKLYHIPFWLGYELFWFFFLVFAFYEVQVTWTSMAILLVYAAVHGGGAILNLYVLMPRFLMQKRYVSYLILLAADWVLMSVVLGGYILWFDFGPGTAWEEVFYLPQFQGAALWSNFSALVISMIIKVLREWRRSQKRSQGLKEENLQTELNLLKAQLNPHFLFNALNSIYFLIHKNPDLAADSLARFSDMLRYQLYECNESRIPLARELGYVENFVELARLRRGDNLQVELEVLPEARSGLIAPFILLPLVENALKHVSDYRDQPNQVYLRLERAGPELWLHLHNTVDPSRKQTLDSRPSGGLGLSNLRRRLELVYPGQHRLDIEEEADHFAVDLRLPFEGEASSTIAGGTKDFTTEEEAIF